MKSLKVLHLVHNLRREGAQGVVRNLASCAADHGIQPIVCPWREGGDMIDDFRKRGVRVVEPPSTVRSNTIATIRYLVGLLESEQVDILHAHMSDAAVIGACAARWSGVPLIVTHHSTRLVPRMAMVKYLARKAALFVAVRVNCTNVAVSPDVAQSLRNQLGLPSARIALIPNGALVPDEAEVAEAANRRTSRRASTTAWPHLVTVGRLIDSKNHIEILRAMPALVSRWPNVRLTIVGDGPNRSLLEQTVQDLGIAHQVSFAGAQPDVVPYLAGADLFVTASQYEGLPLAVVEAMVWSLPVVASDVSGHGLVSQGRAGRLYKLGDIDDLVDAVADVIGASDGGAAAGMVGRDYGRTEYGAGVMADRYEKLYRRLVEKRRPKKS